MYLSDNIKFLQAVRAVDDARIEIGGLVLGHEAVVEIDRLVAIAGTPLPIEIAQKELTAPIYWEISDSLNGQAEVFGFPRNCTQTLPTALEVSIIRALDRVPTSQVGLLLGGNMLIGIGNLNALRPFVDIIIKAKRTSFSGSLLESRGRVVVDDSIVTRTFSVEHTCISGSLSIEPLKFRYMELYRALESRYGKEIFRELKDNYAKQPEVALRRALKHFTSELSQLIRIAELAPGEFEAVADKILLLKGSNDFADALLAKMHLRKQSGVKRKQGAAHIYNIRCAIVHAGDKDLVYEEYPDAEIVIEQVLELMESVSLQMLGITLY